LQNAAMHAASTLAQTAAAVAMHTKITEPRLLPTRTAEVAWPGAGPAARAQAPRSWVAAA
jgi:hypothetical protein